MSCNPSPTQIDGPDHDGKHSCRSSSPGPEPKASLDSTQADRRAQTITLAHDTFLSSERCDLWRDHRQPEKLITAHLITECARASLLADQVAAFRQAELEIQAKQEEHKWTRRQRRRRRYLGIKIKTRPAEAVEQLQDFGEGVEFLVDAFAGLIDEVRTHGFLPPHQAMLAMQVCGCTLEPASIGRNPLAYTLLINNLGCAPAAAAADIEPWLEPVRRPAALRDLPRHALMGADPEECRRRLLAGLEAEHARCLALAPRVREDVDIPSLCEALNRVSILNEQSARRAARSHTEARVTFRQASNDLVKALDREKKNGVGPLSSVPGPLSSVPGPLSSVPGPLSAGNDAEADVPPTVGVPESDGAGPAGPDCPLPTAADAGPRPARGQEDELFHGEPDNRLAPLTEVQDEAVTSVDAWVSGSGCAKVRNTGAQTPPEAAQTGAGASGQPSFRRAVSLTDGDRDREGEAPSEPLPSPQITDGSDGASPSPSIEAARTGPCLPWEMKRPCPVSSSPLENHP
jgi:hypothetical protein